MKSIISSRKVFFTLLLVAILNNIALVKSEDLYDLSNHEDRHKSVLEQFENINSDDNIGNFRLFAKSYPKNSLSFLGGETHNYENDYCNLRPHAVESDFYYFLPVLRAKLHKEGEQVEFSESCFKKNSLKIQKVSNEETALVIVASEPKSYFCKDSYIISLSNFTSIKVIFRHGENKIVLKNLTDNDVMDLNINGVRLFAFCQGFFSSAHSLFMTLKLYLGGFGHNVDSKIPFMRPQVPAYMEKANLEFLDRFTNNQLKSRGKYGDGILSIDKTEIKTGDFIAIYRLDGLDPLIMLGTGSHIGHSAVACWIDGELYILESQDGWYWPVRGIQKNKWDDWITWAHNADFNVAILPLKDEWRQKLNVEKALEFFKRMEGTPYGYRNFIFSWIDTPDKNLPPLLNHESVTLAFNILEKISKNTMDLIMGEGLNMRMGTKNKTLHEIAYLAAEKNMTFESILAIVEKEGWEYSDGLNYVCSCFVVAFYKHGEMFGDLEIEPNEFTPKDVYQMEIFDKEYKDKRPQICKEADPELDYCQVIGKYQLTTPGYSTIKLYPHMNENCPSQAPEYIRPEGC